MAYELGRAEFIIDTNYEDALRAQAKYFAQTRLDAKAVSKELADQQLIQRRDVIKGADVLIAEQKRAAKEQLRLQKEAAAQQKKQIQDRIKNEVAVLKEEEKNRKARARAIIAEEKTIEKERLESVRRQVREEEVIRRRNAIQRQQAEREDARRRQQSSQGPGAGFIRGLPGDIATIAGFGAIASGAILIREALVTLREATLKQEAAQRALNAAFGNTQGIFKANADSLAKQFNLVNSEVELATSRFAVLDKQTVLTSAQIDKLNKVAIDNQAAFGGDLLEAHRSLAGAILGETEAYEKYGVVLQEGVLKTSSKLTEDERRRFTTMSESEKQMIRYRIIMDEASKSQGAAAKRAQETQGGFDALTRATDELAKSIGGKLVPAAGEGARGLAGLINQVTNLHTEYEAVNKAIDQTEKARERKELLRQAAIRSGVHPAAAGLVANVGLTVFDETSRQEIIEQRNLEARQKYRDLEVQNLQRHNKDLEKLETDRRNREEAELKVARERIEAGLRYAHDQEIKRIDDIKKARQGELEFKLRAMETAHKAELQRLEDQENARKQAAELELARIRKERDEALKGIEDRKREELERLDVELEAAKAATEQRVTQLEIERDKRKELAEETRDTELTRLEREQEGRETLRKQEDNRIEDSIKYKERLLEDNHQKAMRRLEREAESARKKSEEESERLDRLIKQEDRRHQKNIQAIDDESDKKLKAIDAEIRALDAEERKRDDIRRRRDLSNQLSDAQLKLRQATGSQDPQARVAAQAKLVAAIRIGDPEAVKKAQAELAEIVGQGTQAIAEAQRDLEDVQIDIRDNDLKETKDAQREKLELEKERIKEETEREKRQEDDRNRKRKDRLEKDKQANEDSLEDALESIERRQEKEQDSFEQSKRELDDLIEYNKRKLDERRREEDLAYERSQEAARNRYEAEQKDIVATYDNEETGLIPATKRALEAVENSNKEQKRVAEDRYRKEQEDVHTTYDDPVNGVIAAHQRAQRSAEIEYGKTTALITASYETARQKVRDAYNHPDGKSGILNQLDTMKEHATAKLNETLRSFKEHADGLVGPGGVITEQWNSAINQAKKYFDYIVERQNAERSRRTSDRQQGPTIPGIPGPDPGMPGGTYVPPEGGNNAAPPLTASPENQVISDPNRTYVPFVTSAGEGSYWTNQGSHKVAGATDNAGAADVFAPAGTPIYAAVDGKIRSASNRIGGNAAILEGKNGYYYYLAHGNVPFVTGNVKMGQLIGEVGNTGSASNTGAHLHFAIATSPDVFDRLEGKGNIKGDSTYWRVRDEGHRFTNPTIYKDMRTGEQGVIAEYGQPEILLGRKASQQFESMGLSRTMNRPAIMQPNYFSLGTEMQGHTSIHNTETAGDTFTYYGVAPEGIMKEWKREQRRDRVLRGRVVVSP